MRSHRFVCLFTALTALPAFGQEQPPLPYIDQGACPFECCTYRLWKAKEVVVAYVEPKEGAPVAFTIKKRQQVTAETGFVVTSKAGITKVLKPIKLGYEKDSKDPTPKPLLDLKPGELLYTLHYLGEGFDLFWYKGKVYSDQISSDKPDPSPPAPERNLQVLSRPVDAWWVKVRTKEGRVGWIKDPPYFENSDACA
jgi:hypothetical protein